MTSKEITFDALTDKGINFAMDRLNHRSRECFGYETPHDIVIKKNFCQKTVALQAWIRPRVSPNCNSSIRTRLGIKKARNLVFTRLSGLLRSALILFLVAVLLPNSWLQPALMLDLRFHVFRYAPNYAPIRSRLGGLTVVDTFDGRADQVKMWRVV